MVLLAFGRATGRCPCGSPRQHLVGPVAYLTLGVKRPPASPAAPGKGSDASLEHVGATFNGEHIGQQWDGRRLGLISQRISPLLPILNYISRRQAQHAGRTTAGAASARIRHPLPRGAGQRVEADRRAARLRRLGPAPVRAAIGRAAAGEAARRPALRLPRRGRSPGGSGGTAIAAERLSAAARLSRN